GAHGASYLGYTQWAFAAAGDKCLKAISTCLVGANAYDFIYVGGAFNLEIFYGWIGMVEAINKSFFAHLKNIISGTKKMPENLKRLPLESLDISQTGKVQSYWRELLAHPSKDDEYWVPANFQKDISKIDVPNHMVSGWYDVMLPGLMKDYDLLCSSGERPFLTIGPWSHFESEASFQSIHHSIIWMRAILLGDKKLLRKNPVKIYVMGANEWREYNSFPPAGIATQTLFLQPGKKLSKNKAPNSQPDTYTYDPSNPTPSVGGAYRTAGTGKSVVDNRKLEARNDVITYETETFINDLEIIGRCEVTLFFSSSVSYPDFFVRVCDVHPNGASYNVCDGILRVAPENKQYQGEEVYKITVELAPTAYRFLKGHKMRLQVSSGSFPRFNRNLGTNDSIGKETTFIKANQQIFHDQLLSSCINLPVMNGVLQQSKQK
ncbi:MAG: CocE/NonD family hydrolase, partial [Bacillota bacterium]